MIFLLGQIFTLRSISVWYSKPYAFKILNDMIHCIKETFGYLECEGASGLFKKFLTIQLTKLFRWGYTILFVYFLSKDKLINATKKLMSDIKIDKTVRSHKI